MSFIGNILGDVFGGITGSTKAAKGAQQAAQTQASSAEAAIAEQRAARLDAQTLQQPFVNAGTSALTQQMALLGLNGTAAQQTGINALLSSPQYLTAINQGEEAILQNASATGGLRGGNTQNSLARYRGDLLSSVLNDQLARLNGVSTLGQNAASGVGAQNLATANNVGSLLQQQGEAIAGGQIASGNAQSNAFNSAVGIAGLLGQLNLLGGKKTVPTSPTSPTSPTIGF